MVWSAWLMALLLSGLCERTLCATSQEDICAGSGAKVRQLVRSTTAAAVTAEQDSLHKLRTPCHSLQKQLLARPQILYDLKTADADSIIAVNKLFQQTLEECQSILYPGSSYGGAAITTTPTAYG
jgi:hypothetical protein